MHHPRFTGVFFGLVLPLFLKVFSVAQSIMLHEKLIQRKSFVALIPFADCNCLCP